MITLTIRSKYFDPTLSEPQVNIEVKWKRFHTERFHYRETSRCYVDEFSKKQ